MARRHGRNGRLYVDIAGGGSASLVAYLAKWTIDAATDKVDVTSMGDGNKTYVTGLRDAKGTFSGFFDDASQQTYTAATDGVARSFYLYTDITNSPTTYFFGQGFFDFSAAGGVAEAVTMSGNWAAASLISRNG